MKTRLFMLAGVALLAVLPRARAQAPAASPSPSTPSFPSQVEAVTVDAVVTDKQGKPVRGLHREDFTVFEDGDPQTITSFDAADFPATPSAAPAPRPRISTNTARDVKPHRSFVVVFDDIHLTPFQAQRAKVAVAEFLKSGVHEGDGVTLVATGGSAWWTSRMEAGREELMTLLKRLDGRFIPDNGPERMTDYEAMRIHLYHDLQVQDRVRRRFESQGVAPVGTGGDDVRAPGDDPVVQGRAVEVYYQAVSRNRITLEIIERVLTSMASVKGRKSMILVSAGFIFDPNLDEFKKVTQASRRSNVAIYFLDTRGLEGLPVSMTAEWGPAIDNQDIGASLFETIEASEGAESVASDSGGFSVKNTNDLSKGIQRIADESRTYYLLGYNPTHTQHDGRFRKIEVRVAPKGLKVRARRGYYAPLDGKAPDQQKVTPGDPDIQAALDSPYDAQEIPLRMTAYVFDETLLGKASVILATDVDVSNFAFQEQEGRLVDTLDFVLVVSHRETGEFFRYDQKVDMRLLPATRDKLRRTGYTIARDFELAPGGYQAKIVIRDKNASRLGTVVHEFDVPELSQLRLSTPILTDAFQPEKDPSKPPQAVIGVRREFASDVMLFCQFEVFGAAKEKATAMPRVSAGYEIRKSDGTLFARGEPNLIKPTSLGKLSRIVGRRLEGATPGDYEFVLQVKDENSGKTIEDREAFTVTAAPAP